MKKKLLILGGSKFIIPVIREAHDMGLYVITCDYLPGNYAHKYSDMFVNISVTDKNEVLQFCDKNNVDGIMSFACDPGVVTACYVAEKLGLPSPGPVSSIEILQNKGQFRSFLKENGFNVPFFKSYSSFDDVIKDATFFRFPIIVKPVDSAGSKGVTKVCCLNELKVAVDYALLHSRSRTFIVEEYIEQDGYSSDCDSFSVDGELKFLSFSGQFFDHKCSNPYVPAGYCWPSSFSNEHKEYFFREIQRLLHLLQLRTSVYNIETRIGKNGIPYIMELSPRGGGNRLSEMVDKVYGINLIKRQIQYSVGLPIDPITTPTKEEYVVELILHSEINGYYDSIFIDNTISDKLIELDLWVNKGSKIGDFSGANEAIGTAIFKFPNKENMDFFLENIKSLVKVIVI